MATRRGPTKEDKERAPSTRVRARGGRVNQRLEMLAKLYRDNNPGQDCRFVYHPEHKPDLSNVMVRQADGYRLVTVKELGEDIEALLPGFKSEDVVRVGDVVMMGIEESIREGYQKELDDQAVEELGRVEQQFYAAIDEIEAADEYKPRPRGKSVTEAVEREVDVDPTLKE